MDHQQAPGRAGQVAPPRLAASGAAVREPIVAIATAAGRGAVGIVRASGSRDAIASVLIALTSTNTRAIGQKPSKTELPARFLPRQACLTPLFDADGQTIDQGLAIWFEAPHSYTGECVLELQVHGGPVVLQLLLARCLQVGAAHGLRPARPGEFTERAFLNHKLDLAQAEAVADLIDASTVQAARSASRSLSGAFSEQIHALLADLIHLRMLVEATLDFPEEEIEHLANGKALEKLQALLNRTQWLGQQAKQGSLLREGIRVVIVGEPNVGKSSLLNALAGSDVAIVTPIAGTTRDRIEHAIQIEGFPVHVIDTAGLRETDDEVEKIGIERTWAALQNADIVLQLIDASQMQAPNDNLDEKLQLLSTPRLLVRNKADLLPDAQWPVDNDQQVHVSARTGQGLDALRQAVLRLVGQQGSSDGLFMARERHVRSLQACIAHLQAALQVLKTASELDLAAEELRLAQNRLSEITGEFSADQLLGEIFSRFCIGK